MLGSIRKFTKSFVAKIFIAIIALPFLLWGMGDVFRSGKQNVLVEINDEKISSKEFITYIQKIQLSKKEIENIGKSKIFDDILTNYISEKIIDIEGEDVFGTPIEAITHHDVKYISIFEHIIYYQTVRVIKTNLKENIPKNIYKSERNFVFKNVVINYISLNSTQKPIFSINILTIIK